MVEAGGRVVANSGTSSEGKNEFFAIAMDTAADTAMDVTADGAMVAAALPPAGPGVFGFRTGANGRVFARWTPEVTCDRNDDP